MTKYFYFYVFLLVFFILGISVYNQYTSEQLHVENFQPNSHVVLLGDSILKNNAYVPQGNSIEELLNENTNGKTSSYAMNNSTIVDTYSQINKIPIELNNPNTTIILSAGGNDILSKYVENTVNHKDENTLNTIFGGYRNLVKSIKAKMNQSKLMLVDVYYPNSMKYKQYHPVIKEWNDKLYDYGQDANNGIHNVLKISNFITEPEDFTLDIEPSQVGGEKIANYIMEKLNSG
jgi:hypothetical protein